jgi:hypothetical protein
MLDTRRLRDGQSMAWQDHKRLESSLVSTFDESQRVKISRLFAVHRFLYGAAPKKDVVSSSRFEDTLVVSKYAETILSRIDISAYTKRDIAMACAIAFFHQDFLIDVERSDDIQSLALVGDELARGNLFLPQRLGRKLYDKFNSFPDKGRVERLEANDVDALLEGSEQGAYQVVDYVAGPLGVLKSAEQRFLPPDIRLPLWHCEDPGCLTLHSVSLIKHRHPAYVLAAKIREAARQIEGPASEWRRALGTLQFGSFSEKRKDYYDIPVLVAEGLSASERAILLTDALEGNLSASLRATLRNASGGIEIERSNANSIAARLSENQTLQLMMTLSDAALVKLIDDATLKHRIKIPATEARKPKHTAPRVSQYDSSCTLSVFGVRSDRKRPILYLSSTIWDEYESAGQLPDLVWRCQMESATPRRGMPVEYMRTHTPHDVVKNLILPSRPITLAIAKKVQLELMPGEPESELIGRFLWKFGFTLPRYDQKYRRLRHQLELLRQEAVKAPVRLSADDRDLIRSKGVNAFVSMENFVEELISFNVWLLSSDHFSSRFEYRFEDAAARVSKILGESREAGQQSFVWNSSGGQTLGALLVYARAAAEWMQKLTTADRESVKKNSSDLPFFAINQIRPFSLLHYELWADAHIGELNDYAKQFDLIVTQLERSRIAEIRNGLDHFREEDKFPSTDNIIACERRLTDAINMADVHRFIPKAFWLTQTSKDEFGKEKYVFEDYNGQKLDLSGPAVVSGLRTPKFSEPRIVPYGNLLGYPNSELTLRLTEESSYSKSWENYPRRRNYRIAEISSVDAEQDQLASRPAAAESVN